MSMQLATADEIGKILKVTAHHVYELAKRGAIPAVKVGRLVRFDLRQIQEWIDKGGHAQDIGSDSELA